MKHEFCSSLGPEQIQERIDQLPNFPGKTEVRENIVCGERTEKGGRLWLLTPKIRYHGSAVPASLMFRLFETDKGTKVRCYFHRVWTIWPFSWFLCAQIAFYLMRDAFQGKIDWNLLPLVLYVDMLEILCVVWVGLWLFELLVAKVFPQIRKSEKWLVQWMETELLAEKHFAIDTVMAQEIARLSDCTEKDM